MINHFCRFARILCSQLVVLVIVLPEITSATVLEGSADKNVRSATYEVVIPKPEADSLSYERPPPLELIPFAIRNDHYIPFGTAFAIAPNRWVTAAHVLCGAVEGSLGAPLLRGGDGKLFAIDKIEALSLREDFVVFSIRDGAKHTNLEPQQHYKIGGQVYAAGNALGQGIVIRDGSLTSETPEERSGEWKWLRFSAAASPGNSGGPLLDEAGKVIGVVLGKSPNENLNFALPISRVIAAPTKVGLIDFRLSYRIPIMASATVATYQKQIPLPEPLGNFAVQLVKAEEEFHDQAQQQLLHENAANIFPKGPGSEKMLTITYTERIATLLSQQTDGHWDIPEPSGINTSELPGGGTLLYALESGWTVLQLKKPADIPVAKLFSDSKMYMDLILKGVTVSRPVMDQSVRITSMGSARREEWFTDSYSRKWQLRVWPMEFMDLAVVSIALPKPDGFVALTFTSPSALLHAVEQQGKYLADFIYTSYSGSLQDWREFLSGGTALPDTFQKIRIDAQYDRKFNYSSPRMSLEIGDFIENVKADSQLTLGFGYSKDHERVLWDVDTVTLSEDPRQKTYVAVARQTRPPPDSQSERMGEWSDMIHQQGSYDGKPHNSEGTTWMSSTVMQARDGFAPPSEDAQHLYSVTFSAGANIGYRDIRNVHGMIMGGLKLLE